MDFRLSPELLAILQKYRDRRGFDPALYLRAKVELLNNYMALSGLSACVVGVSGGVDSAVVLGILRAAAHVPGSPIQKFVAALVPVFDTPGATSQDTALERGRRVAEFFGAQIVTLDLSKNHQQLKANVDQATQIPGGAWAAGQLVSYLRTPAFFYTTSLLTQLGTPAVLVGTTNRDEGGYIGYFGKAADAMVDVQLISDLHKSEVYALARHLGVPDEVIQAVPTGDIYDGRTDEQLIGASYDGIELHTQYLTDLPERREAWVRQLSHAAQAEWKKNFVTLERLHSQCQHKYLGDSPAVHWDVYERAVPGGWRDLAQLDALARVSTEPLQSIPFVNLVSLSDFEPDFENLIQNPPTQRFELGAPTLFEELLSSTEVASLVKALESVPWVSANQNGYAQNFNPATDAEGSQRATWISSQFADLLWRRLAPRIQRVRRCDERGHADWDGSPYWRAVGVSSVHRLIRYAPSGKLVPHYDAPYIFHEGKRTLLSLVLYLTEQRPETGGETRFIVDPQSSLSFSQRSFSDWSRDADPSEVAMRYPSPIGSALVFDHRLLHDADTFRGPGQKIILRTDVVFERVGEAPQIRPSKVSRALGEPEDMRISDPTYREAFSILKSMDQLKRAGYLKESQESQSHRKLVETPFWLTTPVGDAARKLMEISPEEDQHPVVLLSTGAFSPLHKGHIALMEIARAALEKRGKKVIAGYLSPSHDQYVQQKCGDQAVSALHRLQQCDQTLKGSSWLMTDPWESLHCTEPVNFTTVRDRLENYLTHHLGRPVEVHYVFGSDNAHFAKAFLTRGFGVCVERPGHSELFHELKLDPHVQAAQRTLFVNEVVAPDESSTRIRKVQALETPAERPLFTHHHIFRDEGRWAYQHWLKNPLRSAVQLEQAWHRFTSDLVQTIRQHFLNTRLPEPIYHPTFSKVSLDDQIRLAQRILGDRPSISLDPCIPGAIDLEVSRCFRLASGVCTPILRARPGAPSLDQQIGRIPPGSYVLFDDDIATGSTMRTVRQLLPDSVRILEQRALVDLDAESLQELSDCRDFLAGAYQAGLVVELFDGQTARVPYLLPYVTPSGRANTPPSANVFLSYEIWQLNLQFFESLEVPVLLNECGEAFQTLMLKLGFQADSRMSDICRWHLERLELSVKQK